MELQRDKMEIDTNSMIMQDNDDSNKYLQKSEKNTSTCYFFSLNLDILQIMFTYLDTVSFLKLESVNHNIRIITENNAIWSQLWYWNDEDENQSFPSSFFNDILTPSKIKILQNNVINNAVNIVTDTDKIDKSDRTNNFDQRKKDEGYNQKKSLSTNESKINNINENNRKTREKFIIFRNVDVVVYNLILKIYSKKKVLSNLTDLFTFSTYATRTDSSYSSHILEKNSEKNKISYENYIMERNKIHDFDRKTKTDVKEMSKIIAAKNNLLNNELINNDLNVYDNRYLHAYYSLSHLCVEYNGIYDNEIMLNYLRNIGTNIGIFNNQKKVSQVNFHGISVEVCKAAFLFLRTHIHSLKWYELFINDKNDNKNDNNGNNQKNNNNGIYDKNNGDSLLKINENENNCKINNNNSSRDVVNDSYDNSSIKNRENKIDVIEKKDINNENKNNSNVYYIKNPKISKYIVEKKDKNHKINQLLYGLQIISETRAFEKDYYFCDRKFIKKTVKRIVLLVRRKLQENGDFESGLKIENCQEDFLFEKIREMDRTKVNFFLILIF